MDRLDIGNQSLDGQKKRRNISISHTESANDGVNKQSTSPLLIEPFKNINNFGILETSSSHLRPFAPPFTKKNMFTSSNFQGLKRCVSIVFCRFCFMFRFVYLAQVQVRILEVNSPKGLRLTGRGGPWHRSVRRGDGDRADGMMQELLG